MSGESSSTKGICPSPVESSVKVAWGGAGLIPSLGSETLKGLPSHKTKGGSGFSAIQSEDLAKQIDLEETMKVYQSKQNQFQESIPPPSPQTEAAGSSVNADTLNDYCIAQALQHEMDLAHDLELNGQERHINKNSKLNIVMNKHRILPTIDVDRSNEHHWDNLPLDDIDTYSRMKHSTSSGKKKKYSKQDKTGKSTYSSFFDEQTSHILGNIMRKGELKSVGGIISSGKEANVFHAKGGSTEDGDLPEHCVLKIFRTKVTEFKNREAYIKDDHRFSNRVTKTNSIKNVLLWSEKEMRNLKRVNSAGVPCGTPLLCYDNVLVLELIGTPLHPAPQIRSIDLPTENWIDVYEQTLKIMDAITNSCRLVHGDLSEYNLLYHDGKVFVIDFAQAVDLTHCNSLGFLYRDCCNIANFFHKKGVPNVPVGLKLFQQITKLKLSDLKDESQIEMVGKEFEIWKTSNCYSDATFEYLWNASQIRMNEKESEEEEAASRLCKTGCVHKEEWITTKTDGTVIRSGGNTPVKKKRNRKNSNSKHTPVVYHSASPTEDEGFCLVNPKDCVEKPKEGARPRMVRFDDTDTAADTEDYNGDNDTDEVTDTTDVDTDFNVAEDCDTEGYHADADDTDNYVSDTNRIVTVAGEDGDDEDCCPLSNPEYHSNKKSTSTHTASNVKRNVRKRNKKLGAKK